MYVCNVEPGRLFINTEDDTLESGKKLQTDALKHRLCTMRKMWLQEQQESTDPYKHPQASLQNPVPFSDRVTDDSSCKQGPEADIMKASYSGDALVYQLLWYVPEPENSNDPPAHTGKDAWNAWTQHMRVINPNTWIAEALTNGSNWRINYVSSDGKKIAGEPNAGMLDHIRLPVWWHQDGNSPNPDVRDKKRGSKWYKAQTVKVNVNGVTTNVEVEGIMWKKHQWVCAMRSFLTMFSVYPEVLYMLRSITKKFKDVKKQNEEAKRAMKTDATRKDVAAKLRWQQEVQSLRDAGKEEQAEEIEASRPDEPERTDFLEFIKTWSPTAATASTLAEASAPLPTMMVMRHRGSMPRNARLIPRA